MSDSVERFKKIEALWDDYVGAGCDVQKWDVLNKRSDIRTHIRHLTKFNVQFYSCKEGDSAIIGGCIMLIKQI